eukprot:Opistho-2@33965
MHSMHTTLECRMAPSVKSFPPHAHYGGSVIDAHGVERTPVGLAPPVVTAGLAHVDGPLVTPESESCKRLHGKHWLEADDPRHRYGKFLMPYYELWSSSHPSHRRADGGTGTGTSPLTRSCSGSGSGSGGFFEWLDWGAGRGVEAGGVPRSLLDHSQVKYLSERERDPYRVVIQHGHLHRYLSGSLFDSVDGMNKSIFVMGPDGSLYAGLKEVGKFHHSSFL